MARRRTLTVLALACALSPLAAQTPRFNGEVFSIDAPQPSTTFEDLGQMHLFDLDLDGHRDAIVAAKGGLVWLNGTADGRFVDTHQVGATIARPRFFEQDIDRDGRTDLVAGAGGLLAVLRPDGLGGVKPLQLVDLAGLGDFLTVADLDGDGAADIAGLDIVTDVLTIWTNDGTGAFLQGASTPIGEPASLGHGDMDGDGDVDLLMTTFELHDGGYRLAVWLNDGSGQFSPVSDTLVSENESLHVADLDGDGNQDVVTNVEGFSGGFRVLLGDGTGQLAPYVDLPVTYGIDDMLLGDADGDGQLDLIGSRDHNTVYGRDEDVVVVRGLGGGAFDAPLTWNLGPAPVHVAVADVDGQGATDMVVSIPNLTGLAVLRGELDGGLFAERLEHDFGDWTGPMKVRSADLDGDAHRDLIALTQYGLVTLLSDGGTGFTASEPYPVGFEPRDVALGDLDGDGLLDAVVALPAPMKIAVRLGDGAGSWTNTNSVLLAESAYDVALADMNGDGLLDIVAGTAPVSVALGHGNGLFSPALQAPDGVGGYVELGDVDGDGVLDMVSGGQFLNVSFGDGAGGLSEPDVYDLGLLSDLVTSQPRLADLDRDGDLDILIGSYLLQGIQVLENDGAGGFTPGPGTALGLDGFGRLDVGDVTGDGLVDLVAHTHGDGVLLVAEGLGDGSFGPAHAYLAQGSPVDLVIEDVDGDLRPDLLFTTYYLPDTAAALRNLGPEPTWASLPGGLPGSGAPLALQGSGPLTAGSATELRLSGGDAFSVVTLVVGFGELSAPFKGGLLVPTPDLLLTLPLDASGALQLQTSWPAGVPAATALYWQGWMPDAGTPLGLAATNGLRTLTP